MPVTTTGIQSAFIICSLGPKFPLSFSIAFKLYTVQGENVLLFPVLHNAPALIQVDENHCPGAYIDRSPKLLVDNAGRISNKEARYC